MQFSKLCFYSNGGSNKIVSSHNPITSIIVCGLSVIVMITSSMANLHIGFFLMIEKRLVFNL